MLRLVRAVDDRQTIDTVGVAINARFARCQVSPLKNPPANGRFEEARQVRRSECGVLDSLNRNGSEKEDSERWLVTHCSLAGVLWRAGES